MIIKIMFISMTLGVRWRGVRGSVVGITYRDDFDFERRYRRVHECDPFYWHPLHMPEECADMYEQLIRSRLPVRFPKRTSDAYKISPVRYSTVAHAYGPLQYQYSGNPFYRTIGLDVESEPGAPRELTPYEKMLESVQKDVDNFPSVPTVKEMPNFGPVALYQQPVSQITADIINKVAMTYVQSLDDSDGKKQKRDRGKKGKGKWRDLVNKVHRQERKGWKKINNGDIVTFSKS